MAISNSIENFQMTVNEAFVEKADKLTPELIETKVIPQQLVFVQMENGKCSTSVTGRIEQLQDMPIELIEDSADYDGEIGKGWIQEEYLHIDILPAHIELPRRYAFRYMEVEVLDTSAKYKVALKTMQDCMQLGFEDGPKRDRRLWIGDLRLQAKTNYVTFHNNDLVKHDLYLYAGLTMNEGRVGACLFTKPKYQVDDTALFDYSLFFVSILYDYYVETKDEETRKGLAIDYMREYWGGMIKDGTDTFWELYDPKNKDLKPYGSQMVNSYCHAWSCAPAYMIRKYLI